MQGLDDKTVNPSNTRTLAAALRKAGGRVKTVHFKGAGHAELVAAFSILERKRLPVLADIRTFITDIDVHREARARKRPKVRSALRSSQACSMRP